MPIVDLTAESFDQVLRDNPVVLVDFWAAWCSPCRMFDPVYESAAAHHDGIVFTRVDVDAHPRLIKELGVASIPTLMAFRDGRLVATSTDALPLRALNTFIDGVCRIDMTTFGRDPMDDIPELDM